MVRQSHGKPWHTSADANAEHSAYQAGEASLQAALAAALGAANRRLVSTAAAGAD